MADFFKPLVVQVVERISSSPSPQPALLEEALVACHVLIKINSPGAPPPQVWSLIDSQTEQLVSSKIISAAAAQDTSTSSKLMYTMIHTSFQHPWDNSSTSTRVHVYVYMCRVCVM